MITVIIACEIGFWLLLLAGLVARYILRARRLSTLLLAAVPLVDVVLLIVTVVDVRRGAALDPSHALAAAYIGISVMFGPGMIHWADQKFAARFGDRSRAADPPKFGAAHAREERIGWYRHLGAWLICLAMQGLIHLVGGNRDETAKLFQLPLGWLVILGIDFVWSFSYTLFPKEPPKTSQ